MYIVTFYSFKGGTGRSMALANVAAELALRGKSVLLVDFDLEAPGLDTFPLRKPRKQASGLVEYIHEYLDTGHAPDVREFAYKTCPDGSNAADMWVMPAGKQDETYEHRFRSIDWKRLYEEEDGFLLFEDLKAQWRAAFNPDYVLIDSRTGHTDIGGICTRQLPDAVVMMFVPNEQNRRGLKPVVDDVRSEEQGPLKKSIKLHFVMANVPDLDDEEEILSEQVSRFQTTLQYKELSGTIHHYNSLLMLDQILFVIARPKSKIAREYRMLVESIIRENVEDAQGAIMFLDDAIRSLRLNRATVSPNVLDNKLQKIKDSHALNPNILRRLATLQTIQRRDEDALGVLDQVSRLGGENSEVLLERAELNIKSGKREAALQDLARLFSLPQAEDIDISLAVQLQLALDPKGVLQIANSQMLYSIDSDTLIDIIRELQGSVQALEIADVIVSRWLDLQRPRVGEESLSFVLSEYSLCLIGLGKFEHAMNTIRNPRPEPNQLDMQDAFNYAMAEWGHKGEPPRDLLMRVLSDHETSNKSGGPNYNQCISLCYFLLHQKQHAYEHANRALTSVIQIPDTSFSAWSYLMVSAERFAADVRAMIDGFDRDIVAPEFIVRSGHHRVIQNGNAIN